MKRSPLKRKTPLRSPTTWHREVALLRKTWIKGKRSKQRRDGQCRDRDYLDAVKALGRCCAADLANAGECWGPIDPDHYGTRGMGQKTSDLNVYSICRHHHIQRHALSGPFKGWSKAALKQWCEEQIMATSALLSTGSMLTQGA